MSATTIRYKCDKCGQECQREDLMVKRVQFREMGARGKVIMTRTLAWLCRSCLGRDSEWARPAFTAAPGTEAKREG